MSNSFSKWLWLQTLILLSVAYSSSSSKRVSVFKQVLERSPIFPNDKSKVSVAKDLNECEIRCTGNKYFLFSRPSKESSIGQNCICVNDETVFHHGLVPATGFNTYIATDRSNVLDNFLYMNVVPLKNSEILSKDLDKIELEMCAFRCLNNLECKAFHYDIIQKRCSMFKDSYLSKIVKVEESNTTTLERTLYFEELSLTTKYFASTWAGEVKGLTELIPTTYDGTKENSAENCAISCFNNHKCKSFNYKIFDNKCTLYSGSVASGKKSILEYNREFIYFEMIPSLECPVTSIPNTNTEGMILSPGWPYSFSKAWMGDKVSCDWKIMTAWGRSLIFDLKYYKLEKDGSTCLQTLNINKFNLCGNEGTRTKTTNTDNEISNMKLTIDKWNPTPQEGIGFIVKYSTGWRCQPILQTLQGPGEIASNSYPKLNGEQYYCNWELKTDPSTETTIEFRDMQLYPKNGIETFPYIEFKSTTKTVKCEKDDFIGDCKKKMVFVGTVLVKYSAVGANAISPIRGFWLKYYFGDRETKLKDYIETIKINLEKKSIQTLYKSDLQKYRSTKLTYEIENPLPMGIVTLRFLNLSLSDTEGFHNCPSDSVAITDPSAVDTKFTFCGQITPDGNIISTGQKLIVNVIVQEMAFSIDARPRRSFAIEVIGSVKEVPPSPVYISDNTEIKSVNFPNEYPINSKLSYIIQGEGESEPILDIKVLHLAEFKYAPESTPTCDNDRFTVRYLNNSQQTSFCGHDESAEGKIFISGKDKRISVEFTSDDIYNDKGFQAFVKFVNVSRCVPGETMETTGMNFLTNENFPLTEEKKSGVCSWKLQSTTDTTGVVLNIKEGCQTINYILPDDENKTISVDCTSSIKLFLPTESILIWNYSSTKNNRKFLATIEDIDLTTTMVPTTMVPTTTVTTTTSTTEKIKATVPGPAARKANTAPMIGGGVAGALLIIGLIIGIVVWRMQVRRRLLQKSEEKFPALNFYDNPEYRNVNESDRNKRDEIKSIPYSEEYCNAMYAPHEVEEV